MYALGSRVLEFALFQGRNMNTYTVQTCLHAITGRKSLCVKRWQVKRVML